MNHSETLDFFLTILENLRIPAHILQEPYNMDSVSAFSIRKIAYPKMNYENFSNRFFQSCKSNTIYQAFDEFFFHYLILMLPDNKESSFLVIGPYALEPFTETDILNKAQEFNIPPESYPLFKQCYETVPILSDSSTLFTLVNSYASTLWGSMDSFVMEELTNLTTFTDAVADNLLSAETAEELIHSMKNADIRYAAENEFLQIIAQGQTHKIEMYLNEINLSSSEQRHVDKVRNAKNYAIIMNTLLRKTVEQSTVPPVHIDRVSSAFAKKIELQTSEGDLVLLLKEMARKYAFLVKNHSMKGYSPLIRQVLTHIDNDLSVDLSLKTLASLVSTNPSYLSTCFKKETGHTLTEYVTEKRIQHAIFLLNATNMQVQTIASYCGIPDVCYFSKIFKRLTGKTPTEYREYILT